MAQPVAADILAAREAAILRAEAALQNVTLNCEPYYSGREDHQCTAERFLRAVNSLRAANLWDDVRTIVQAQKFLKGEAEVYFMDSLPLDNPDLHARTQVSWNVWQEEFKRRFFAVATAADVSTAWAKLHQLEQESAQSFYIRVTTNVRAYADHFPAAPADWALLGRPDPPATLIDDLVGAADAAAVRAVLLDPWRASHNIWATRVRTVTLATNSQVLVRKVFIAGLRNAEFKTAAKRLDNQLHTNGDILDAVVAREADRRPPPDLNRKIVAGPRPSINSIIHSMAGLEMPPEETESVSAVGQQRNGNRGRGRGGRGRGRQTQQSRPSATAGQATQHQPPQQLQSSSTTQQGQRQQFAPRFPANMYTAGATCAHCQVRGHTATQCQKRANGFPAALASAAPAATPAWDAAAALDAVCYPPQGNAYGM